jgi:alpha-beta hydrolase superfamily lysophospholipase
MNLELLEGATNAVDSDKPPLLFIHGVLHGAWCWELFLEYFSEQGFPCYALSLRGHGASPIEGHLNHARIKDYVDDVRTAVTEIEQRNGRSPFIVGHSMGGFIVQKYLERYAVPGAVLLASAPTHGVIQTMFRMFLRAPLMATKVLALRDMRFMVANNQLTRAFAFSDEMPEADVTRHRLRMGGESFMAFMDMLFQLPKTQLIKADMLVLGSDRDTVFTVAETKKTAKAYGAELKLFQGMGHDMMLEPRWQSVADAIANWLSFRAPAATKSL